MSNVSRLIFVLHTTDLLHSVNFPEPEPTPNTVFCLSFGVSVNFPKSDPTPNTVFCISLEVNKLSINGPDAWHIHFKFRSVYIIESVWHQAKSLFLKRVT